MSAPLLCVRVHSTSVSCLLPNSTNVTSLIVTPVLMRMSWEGFPVDTSAKYEPSGEGANLQLLMFFANVSISLRVTFSPAFPAPGVYRTRAKDSLVFMPRLRGPGSGSALDFRLSGRMRKNRSKCRAIRKSRDAPPCQARIMSKVHARNTARNKPFTGSGGAYGGGGRWHIRQWYRPRLHTRRRMENG